MKIAVDSTGHPWVIDIKGAVIMFDDTETWVVKKKHI